MAISSNSENDGQTATQIAKPPPSFYRRTLPDSCVALSSRRGKQLFQSAMSNGGLKSFFPLMEQHSTQSEPAYCGITTLTIALNAMSVDPKQNWKGPWRWYEETMLNCCISLEEVKKTGITIRVFNCLAICQGLAVNVYYVDDESVTLDTFRDVVRQACVEDQADDDDDGGINCNDDSSHTQEVLRDVLVVSYNRKVLSQTGSGHFSPIAAYDEPSDSVLIMDTARFKYGVHWVKLSKLYEAMTLEDPDSGRSRGFIMLSNPESDDQSCNLSHLPVSLLLRSQMKAKHVRRRYKKFLSSVQGVTWNDVYGYWTNNFVDTKHIWEIVGPAFIPTSAQEKEVSDLRNLIMDIMPHPPHIVPSGRSRCCGGKFLDVTSDEAIFIVYLASISNDDADEILRKVIMEHPNSSKHSEETIRQLIAEANLIRYCIETVEESIDVGEVEDESTRNIVVSVATAHDSNGRCNPDMISYERKPN